MTDPKQIFMRKTCVTDFNVTGLRIVKLVIVQIYVSV